MENYNTPPSTESSLDDSPMDLSSETKEPIQEISSSSSPASARWVSSQPVCLRSLLATAQEQLDCSRMFWFISLLTFLKLHSSCH